MRINQSKLLKIKSKTPSNLFHEKYGHKLGEFSFTAETEKVKTSKPKKLLVLPLQVKTSLT